MFCHQSLQTHRQQMPLYSQQRDPTSKNGMFTKSITGSLGQVLLYSDYINSANLVRYFVLCNSGHLSNNFHMHTCIKILTGEVSVSVYGPVGIHLPSISDNNVQIPWAHLLVKY